MSFAEIEVAIKNLPREELARFNEWYEAFLEAQWDDQIRQDARGGKLDFLLEEARKEREAGTLRRFP